MYESSARVDVGGDIYDFLSSTTGDSPSCSVTSPVTVSRRPPTWRWRSSCSARSPASIPSRATSSRANDVVVDEIAPGKFITMVYVAVDPARGEVACANAGHPPPRLVLPDGTVRGLDAPGSCSASTRARPTRRCALRSGRRDGRALHRRCRRGAERGRALRHRTPRRLLARTATAGAELAACVTEHARVHAGGELADDLAVVVIRRAADRAPPRRTRVDARRPSRRCGARAGVQPRRDRGGGRLRGRRGRARCPARGDVAIALGPEVPPDAPGSTRRWRSRASSASRCSST